MPVSRKNECVLVWIDKGRRRDDLIRIGKYDDCGNVNVSSNTLLHMSEEELVDRNETCSSLWSAFPLPNCAKEEEAQTGISCWHYECLMEELDITFYLQRFEHELTYAYSKYEREQIQHKIEKIKTENYNPFNNEYLAEKLENQMYSLWNQNIVSKSGQYYSAEAVNKVIKAFKALKHYSDAQGGFDGMHNFVYDEEELAQLMHAVDFPSDVLRRFLELQGE
jgi:hypothetical protein